MLREATISSTTPSFACHGSAAWTIWPVTLPTPTTLLTWPAGVLPRFLENRSGTAEGSLPMAEADEVMVFANWLPAYDQAPTNVLRWYAAGSTPRKGTERPGMCASVT